MSSPKIAVILLAKEGFNRVKATSTAVIATLGPAGLLAVASGGFAWLLAQQFVDIAPFAPSLLAASFAAICGGIVGLLGGLVLHKNTREAILVGGICVIASGIVAMLLAGYWGMQFELASSAGSGVGLLTGINGKAGMAWLQRNSLNAAEKFIKSKGLGDEPTDDKTAD